MLYLKTCIRPFLTQNNFSLFGSNGTFLLQGPLKTIPVTLLTSLLKLIKYIFNLTRSLYPTKSTWERCKKIINYLAGIFPQKIRALQTVLNGLKHEKNEIKCVSPL